MNTTIAGEQIPETGVEAAAEKAPVETCPTGGATGLCKGGAVVVPPGSKAHDLTAGEVALASRVLQDNVILAAGQPRHPLHTQGLILVACLWQMRSTKGRVQMTHGQMNVLEQSGVELSLPYYERFSTLGYEELYHALGMHRPDAEEDEESVDPTAPGGDAPEPI